MKWERERKPSEAAAATAAAWSIRRIRNKRKDLHKDETLKSPKVI